MEVVSVIPRGYCQGVVRAILQVKNVLQQYPNTPITMLGMIVHNQYVVQDCEKHGIRIVDDPKKTRLELLDDVHEGVVIITAHGASDAVFEKAKAKGLTVVDATCPDVLRTHRLVKEHLPIGDVIYIGKAHHPEAEGVCGISDRVHLVTSVEDVASLPDLQNPLITNQTTLSMLDNDAIMQAAKNKFPNAICAKEICNATRIRQEAVLALKDKQVDTLIVVGDPRSNNSNQLRKLGETAGIPHCLMIEHAQQLDLNSLQQSERVAITSGSSTPTALTNQVIEVLETYAKTGEWKLPSLLPAIL